MQPTIKTITDKKLTGVSKTMSFAHYTIAELWQQFMPNRRFIENPVNNNLISLVNYSPTHFTKFSLDNTFERWAAVEVADFQSVPYPFNTFIIPAGVYAVFHYKGLNTDPAIFQYIYGTWIPESEFALDNRPHFEVLGDKYKNNDPESEEEIWIPIQLKSREKESL